MPMVFKQFCRFAVVAGTLAALVGCNRMSELGFDTKLAVGSVSLVDRCSDFMHRAYPENGLDVAGSHVDADAQTAIVTLEAVRGDVPATSAFARQVAVECRFEGGILTSFRWTAGPVRPGGSGPAP